MNQDIICDSCQNVISGEEIEYGFFYEKNGRVYCDECVKETNQ